MLLKSTRKKGDKPACGVQTSSHAARAFVLAKPIGIYRSSLKDLSYFNMIIGVYNRVKKGGDTCQPQDIERLNEALKRGTKDNIQSQVSNPDPNLASVTPLVPNG